MATSNDTALGDLGSDGDSDSSTPSTSGLGGLATLPFTAAGVYAFVDSAAVSASMTGLGLTSGLATAVTAALFLVGALTVAGIGVLAVITVGALLSGLIKRSPVSGGIGVLGLVYFGASAAIAKFVFGGLPLLVGFVLGSTLFIYAIVLLVVAVVGLGVVAMV